MKKRIYLIIVLQSWVVPLQAQNFLYIIPSKKAHPVVHRRADRPRFSGCVETGNENEYL